MLHGTCIKCGRTSWLDKNYICFQCFNSIGCSVNSNITSGHHDVRHKQQSEDTHSHMYVGHQAGCNIAFGSTYISLTTA